MGKTPCNLLHCSECSDRSFKVCSTHTERRRVQTSMPHKHSHAHTTTTTTTGTYYGSTQLIMETLCGGCTAKPQLESRRAVMGCVRMMFQAGKPVANNMCERSIARTQQTHQEEPLLWGQPVDHFRQLDCAHNQRLVDGGDNTPWASQQIHFAVLQPTSLLQQQLLLLNSPWLVVCDCRVGVLMRVYIYAYACNVCDRTGAPVPEQPSANTDTHTLPRPAIYVQRQAPPQGLLPRQRAGKTPHTIDTSPKLH